MYKVYMSSTKMLLKVYYKLVVRKVSLHLSICLIFYLHADVRYIIFSRKNAREKTTNDHKCFLKTQSRVCKKKKKNNFPFENRTIS